MELTLNLVLFNFFLFILLMYGFWPTLKGPKSLNRFDYKYRYQIYYYGLVILILSVFGYSDLDFWSYQRIFDKIIRTRHQFHLEAIYTWLALQIEDYIIWRLAVWSLATVFMLKTIKRLPTNQTATLFFITIIYAINFYKLRNTLGFSLVFWGLTIFVCTKQKKYYFDRFWGLVFIFCSFFFHGSMGLTIALLGCCFFRYNKFWTTVALCSWPLLITAITVLIHIVSVVPPKFTTDVMGISDKIIYYANGNPYGERTIAGLIRSIIDNFAILFSLLYMTKKFVYDRIQSPRIIRYFFQIWFAATYIAYLFVFQDTAFWIFVRINTMGFFPMAVVLGWYFGTHKRNIPQRLILFSCSVSFLYSIVYLVYKQIQHS